MTMDISNMMKVSLDGNYLSNPDLLPFLIKLKNENIRADLRVSQKQFIESNNLLRGLSDAELISVIEVDSVDLNDMNFIQDLHSSNASYSG